MHTDSYFTLMYTKADNSNKIRKVCNELLERNLPFTDFTDTMIVGSSQQHIFATSEKTEQDLEYFGICMFGDTSELKEITRKFGLFK